jgi:flagellar hook-length control protein FliK
LHRDTGKHLESSVDSLPALPADLPSLLGADGAQPLASARFGAEAMPPRGSPDGETLSALAPHPFAGFLLSLQVPVPDGHALPADGKSLPLPPVSVPVVGLERAGAGARASPQPGGVAASGEAAVAVPGEAEPGARLLQSVQPAGGLETILRPPVEAHRPEAASALAAALRAETSPDAAVAPRPVPLPQRSGADSPARRAAGPAVGAESAAGAASLRAEPKLPGGAVDLELPIKLQPGRAEAQPAIPEPRGLPPQSHAAVIGEPGSPVAATSGPGSAAAPSSSAEPPPALPGTATQSAADATEPRWSEALVGRVRWMVDHNLGEARIRLNPPELGALEIKIALVDERAFVQLAATQSGARELLEASLPRLRELLTAGGLELANASVSDGGEQRAARPRLDLAVEPEISDLAELAPAGVRRPHPGRIDLYA